MPILLTENSILRGHATYLKQLNEELIYQLARGSDINTMRDAARKMVIVSTKLQDEVEAYFNRNR